MPSVKRVPESGGVGACRYVVLWNWGVSSIPPEALPYLIGSYTMDTAAFRNFWAAIIPSDPLHRRGRVARHLLAKLGQFRAAYLMV